MKFFFAQVNIDGRFLDVYVRENGRWAHSSSHMCNMGETPSIDMADERIARIGFTRVTKWRDNDSGYHGSGGSFTCDVKRAAPQATTVTPFGLRFA